MHAFPFILRLRLLPHLQLAAVGMILSWTTFIDIPEKFTMRSLHFHKKNVNYRFGKDSQGCIITISKAGVNS